MDPILGYGAQCLCYSKPFASSWKRKQAGRILYIQRIMATNTKYSKSEASGLRRVCVSSESIAYIDEIVCEPHSQEIDTDDK